ncbi:MAG TPA: hypothetical protein VHF24_12200 [Acidimicrobiales bacterium]|nr:hypothetical protein [Acidimicrobiales bacterium]
MNPYLTWYRRAVWFGITANMSFALTALYAPAKLLKTMRLRPIASTAWLRNVGMLLVVTSLFNAGAARDPRRYPLYSYFVPTARLIAGSFFLGIVIRNPHSSSERPRAFAPLFVFDTTMGVVCAGLLYLGLREDRERERDAGTATPGRP